jgi:hypothetical protein
MSWKRTDGNQTKIVNQLRQLGFSVAITSMVGNGFPDLVVSNAAYDKPTGKYWKTILVELKDPNQSPSARKLSPDEKKFHEHWKGYIVIATQLSDITNYFGMNL